MPLESPTPIFIPAPAGKETLVITGTTSPNVSGTLRYAGSNAGKVAWSTDGTLTSGAANVIMQHNGTQWVLSLSSTYSATKTSSANDPTGLSTWTIGTGTGQPTVAAGSVTAPPIVTA